jgi:SAM-dependent methyltransferase
MSVDRPSDGRAGPLKAAAKRVLSAQSRRALRRLVTVRPPVGLVRFGSLRRLTPFSRRYGFERGTPIDRYYIETFLSRHAGEATYGTGDIHGRVLEVGDDMYTRKFGTAVTKSDVLHAGDERPEATIVGDLTSVEGLPAGSFDCVICTQTLNVIYDVRAAIATLHRALAPGGVLLVTIPGISQICRPENELWGDYWRFTVLSIRRLLEEAFPPENVTVEAYGNVLASAAFLYGLATEELKRDELEPRDPDYELLIAARAVK